ncbi:MAG: hypothetical protein M0D55_06430 [Elusimicrobiota bacterium]|nr:MAG: hypothetical protein M0D55_06430 [Elusimicrobiota bacterium]
MSFHPSTKDPAAPATGAAGDAIASIGLSTKEKLWLTKMELATLADLSKAVEARKAIVENLKPNPGANAKYADAAAKYTAAIGKTPPFPPTSTPRCPPRSGATARRSSSRPSGPTPTSSSTRRSTRS